MGFFSDFGEPDGVAGSGVASPITRAGKLVACSHCGGQKFYERTAQLNTPAMTFLDLDWANKSATVYVCQSCGHLEWFL